uniref:Uncharacterized protein n=1 Tax=Anguilla anguilla TaxID=7936 RepID=A0A0E9QZJ5_ANGAN
MYPYSDTMPEDLSPRRMILHLSKAKEEHT